MLKRCAKTHIQLANVRNLRHNMTSDAAKVYMFPSKMAHLTYCLLVWASADVTSLRSVTLDINSLLTSLIIRQDAFNIVKF